MCISISSLGMSDGSGYFFPVEKSLKFILLCLTSFFSNILKVHYTKDKSKNNLASILRISPFFVGEYEVAARNYPIRKLVMIIEYLREYDLKSKGVNNASASNSVLLKELVFKILH